jgi:hypothetical protein
MDSIAANSATCSAFVQMRTASSMTGSNMSTQPLPITAALLPGPGLGASTAELRARAVPPPPHPCPLPDQTGVLGISSASGDDRPIALLLLALRAGAGLAGASGRYHRGRGAVAPEGHVTLSNTWLGGRRCRWLGVVTNDWPLLWSY